MVGMFSTLANSPRFARLPVRIRRGAVRSYWRSQCLIGQSLDFGLRPVFSQVLRVSDDEAERLQREVAFQDLIATTGWATLRHMDRSMLERDMAAIAIPDDDMLDRLARDRRPVVLAPMHMGAFALPLARIVRDYFGNRPMLILRARSDLDKETYVMLRIAELGIDMRFLDITDKQAYLEAIRFARKGAVIVCFADLPGSHGSPQAVSLFGQSSEIALGLASLARVTEASVVPMAVYSSVRGDQVMFDRPFECRETGPDERARIANLLAEHIETSVLTAPEQWHMWPRFHEYEASRPANLPVFPDAGSKLMA